MTILITAGIVLAAFILLVIFLIAPGRGAKETREKFYHLNIAHRGLHNKSKTVPENSMAAFEAAAVNGYAIELDIQLTKDEQVVVFHDGGLARVCGIDKNVDECTYEELQELSICGTDQKIPLFSDLLKLVNGRVPLLVELKNNYNNRLLCEKAVELLRGYNGVYCVESFTPFILGWFRKNAPGILRGQLSAPSQEFKGQIPFIQRFCLGNLLSNCIARPHFVSYFREKRSLTVKLCEAMGAMKFVWTVRGKDDYKHFESINDAVIFEMYKPKIKY